MANFFAKIVDTVIAANKSIGTIATINPSTYSRGHYSGFLPQITDLAACSNGNYFSFNGISSCLSAYNDCPPLQAICKSRANALANGILKIYNSVGKEVKTPQANAVQRLLSNPNPLQTKTQFFTQLSIYLDLVGYVVILPVTPVGFSKSDANSLWIVPPYLVDIQEDTRLDLFNGGLQNIFIDGVRVNYKDVILITNYDVSTTKQILPNSAIKSLERPINNIIGALESKGILINQRGPSGILTPKVNPMGSPIPLLDHEKKELQSQFNVSYGFRAHQSHLMIADAALDYMKVGFNYKELGLDEAIIEDTKIIADNIGYPSELLSIINPIHNNASEAGKRLYQDFIIPTAKNIAEQFTSYLLQGANYFQFEFDHVPALQKDKLKEFQAFNSQIDYLTKIFKLNAITINQMLTQLGQELLDEVNGNKYYSDLKDVIDPKSGNLNFLTNQTASNEQQ